MNPSYWINRKTVLALIIAAVISVPSALCKRHASGGDNAFTLLFLQAQVFYLMHSMMCNIAIIGIIIAVVIQQTMAQEQKKKPKKKPKA